jgi:hypothetical protein
LLCGQAKGLFLIKKRPPEPSPGEPLPFPLKKMLTPLRRPLPRSRLPGGTVELSTSAKNHNMRSIEKLVGFLATLQTKARLADNQPACRTIRLFMVSVPLFVPRGFKAKNPPSGSRGSFGVLVQALRENGIARLSDRDC